MTKTSTYAARELDILSKSCTDPNDRPVIEEFKNEILAICEKFGQSGQSGGSAPYTATAISKAIKHLCLFEPICPITGIDDEWVNVTSYTEGEVLYQNSRCSALFKDTTGVYYLDAITWKGEEDWDTFSGTVNDIKSRQYIKEFPFTPKTFYIDVIRTIIPNDCDTEPYYENKYYSTEIFEKTGVKEWVVERYTYVLKNPKQLESVWKYYEKPEYVTL